MGYRQLTLWGLVILIFGSAILIAGFRIGVEASPAAPAAESTPLPELLAGMTEQSQVREFSLHEGCGDEAHLLEVRFRIVTSTEDEKDAIMKAVGAEDRSQARRYLDLLIGR